MAAKQNKLGECVGLVGLSNKRRYGDAMPLNVIDGWWQTSKPHGANPNKKPKPPPEPALVPLKKRKKLLAKKQGHR